MATIGSFSEIIVTGWEHDLRLWFKASFCLWFHQYLTDPPRQKAVHGHYKIVSRAWIKIHEQPDQNVVVQSALTYAVPHTPSHELSPTKPVLPWKTAQEIKRGGRNTPYHPPGDLLVSMAFDNRLRLHATVSHNQQPTWPPKFSSWLIALKLLM